MKAVSYKAKTVYRSKERSQFFTFCCSLLANAIIYKDFLNICNNMFRILNNRYLSSDVEVSIEWLQKRIQQIGQSTVQYVSEITETAEEVEEICYNDEFNEEKDLRKLKKGRYQNVTKRLIDQENIQIDTDNQNLKRIRIFEIHSQVRSWIIWLFLSLCGQNSILGIKYSMVFQNHIPPGVLRTKTFMLLQTLLLQTLKFVQPSFSL